MNKLNTILLAATLGATVAHAQIRPATEAGYGLDERAIESAIVRLLLEKDGTGAAIARACNQCKPMKLRVTKKTKVVIDGEPIQWDSNLNFAERHVDVYYSDKRKTVNRFIAR